MKNEKLIRVFVVEGDEYYRGFIKYNISLQPEYEVIVYANAQELFENIYKRPQVIILNYSLPEFNGVELLLRVQMELPGVPVIFLSEKSDMQTAVEMIRNGAFDFIPKNEFTKDHLLRSIQKISEKINEQPGNEISIVNSGKNFPFSDTIQGNCEAIKKVFQLMEKASNTNITVSISGETGTGKELVAKSIHFHSTRKGKPFVAINMAAIPKELLESELFGSEKGAFTGAHTTRAGKFEEAGDGTIFLDEIAEMDLALQAKLLRAIQEREISRIGSGKLIHINARFIVASHRDIYEEVMKGKFREDLYYRLMGLPIHIPPLRERGNDILIIAQHLLDRFCEENKLAKMQFSSAAQEKLIQYHYRGNVRELKSIVELSSVMASSSVIEVDDIRTRINPETDTLTFEETTLEEFNMRIIRHFLAKYNYNVVLTAKKLNVGKSTIYRYLKENKILLPEKSIYHS